MEGVGVQCVVQAHHLLLCARGVRLHDMGGGGVHDGGALVKKDDAVQTVGVAGAVDALDRLPLLLGLDGQPLHQRRFAAARPAFDEIHLHPRFPPKRLKIALEPGGGGGAQKEINRIAAYSIHTQTPHFCYRVCKNEVKGVLLQSASQTAPSMREPLTRRESFPSKTKSCGMPKPPS